MNKRWNDYFSNIQNKYNLKMNKIKPIAILLDGKNLTKSLECNLITENKNSFNDIFEQTIKYFSEKLGCMAISGVDEVSFIIKDSKKLEEFLAIKKYRAQDIVSIFSQQFYNLFNKKYNKAPVYWHCKCLNIPKGKIKSYIEFRSVTIYQSKLTYFLKRKQIRDAGMIPLAEQEKMCNELPGYEEIKEFARGNMYVNGRYVNLNAFLNDQIIEMPEIERRETREFLDLNDF